MTKTNCKMTDEKLTDVLLDPQRVPAKVQSHVAECGDCHAKLKELEATMQLLDGWEAPEPNAYFMTRLGAKMREEREAAPTGRLSRRWAGLRARMAYGGGLHARPLAAMAMTAVLLLGGGAYLGITDWMHTTQPVSQAAVVHDLQTLDNNAQVLDQMEALSSNPNGD
ncbi:MAG: anti-sigma factor family protein [Terracidiphilus sp.]